MDSKPTDPNAAWYPEAPNSQAQVEKAEQLKIASSVGIVQDVITWFEANAGLYASLDSLNIDDSTNAEDAKLAILVSKKLRQAFKSKAEDFRVEYEQHIQGDQTQP